MQRGALFKRMDPIIVGIYILLMILGWFSIYAADYTPEHPSVFDSSQEYGKQFIWILLCLAVAFVVLLIDTDVLSRYAYVVYGIVMFLLLLVLVAGKEVNGARSWFGIGSFGIQPSEFAKFACALAMAKLLSTTNIKMTDMSTKLKAVMILAIPSGLILLQPDMGTVLIFVAFVLVMYREGLSGNILLIGILSIVLSVLSLILKESSIGVPFTEIRIAGHYILMFLILGISALAYWLIKSVVVPRARKSYYILLAVTIIGSSSLIGGAGYVVENVLAEHQKTRVHVLLGLKNDPQGYGWNVRQSKMAIGSGGFAGKGFLKGTLTKYRYVPMQSTDFIFCTIGEEWGFIGSTIVIILFLVLIIRMIHIGERQRSNFTRIYAYCAASILFIHLTINVGMALGLAPVIGIPLPFFSYGGSSLIGFTLLIFILVRADAQRMDRLR